MNRTATETPAPKRRSRKKQLPPFDYDLAFSRNIGWTTTTEQAILRHKRVAIAGMGGVGGAHVITHTRLGVGAFNLSDFDVFELQNFNRQAGASLPHVHKTKVDVMKELATNINPELDIRLFPKGVGGENMGEFLDDVDIYIDSLDFFAVEARRQVFAACAERGIPAVTAAPLGMGAAMLIFMPGKMSFEEYFRLEGEPEEEQLIRFFMGLSPAMVQQRYLVDPTTINLAEHRGPSTIMGCEMCASAAAAQSLKILLDRGPILAAPHGLHFDGYRNKVVRTWLPGGSHNPLQKLKLSIVRKQFEAAKARASSREVPKGHDTAVHRILDLARWAPSGDNTQPWRFQIHDDRHLTVHCFDTRDHVVYDLLGRASQISMGAMLETLEIGAQGEGLTAKVSRREEAPETHPVFDVELVDAPEARRHPLEPVIRARVTQRRPLAQRPLAAKARKALEECVGEGYYVVWREGEHTRKKVAKLLFKNAHIRLTTPEAYTVHRDIIEWGTQFSRDRIPELAVGGDPVAMRAMRWAMASWGRVEFMNRYLGGTLLPRLQLDVLPAIKCAAHFVIVAKEPPKTLDDFVAGGRAMQRFWLTATKVGLQFQPEMTPLIFASYVRNGVQFSHRRRSLDNASDLTKEMEHLFGRETVDNGIFMGRVGYGPAPTSRSIRLALEDLIVSEPPARA